MAGELTYEELKERIKLLESDLARYRSPQQAVFHTSGWTNFVHPDWPETKCNISGLFAHPQSVGFLVCMMNRLGISHPLALFQGAPDVIWNGGRLQRIVHERGLLGVSFPTMEIRTTLTAECPHVEGCRLAVQGFLDSLKRNSSSASPLLFYVTTESMI